MGRLAAAFATLACALAVGATARAAEPTPGEGDTPQAARASPSPPDREREARSAPGAAAKPDGPTVDGGAPERGVPPGAPVGPADRAALAALAASLPRHGVLPLTPPAPDGDDAAWRELGRALLDVFAPRSLRDPGRASLVATTRPLAPAIDAFIPRHRRYLALQRALAQAARRLEGGHPTIRRPPYEVRVGLTAPEVGQLRERLLLEGYSDPGVTGRLRNYFDPRLKRALWRWQRDHGLPVTVVLDHLTRRRLNAPLGDLVAAIALSLERWRALDLRDDAGPVLLVHLNRFELRAEDDGVEALSMKVIIGRATAKDATLSASAPLFEVVVHPEWRVPQRITEESLKPKAEQAPEVLRDMGYAVRVDGAGRWWVRQPPGPDNPLGVLKFRLRGTRGVYLHDTIRAELFAKPDRARSHGCVRLASPRALAQWLLPGRLDALDEALTSRRTTTFKLDPPQATHLVYQTLTVHDDGRVLRHPDVYQRDPEALARHDGAALRAALQSLGSPCSDSTASPSGGGGGSGCASP